MGPGRYRIVVRGGLSDRFASVFAGLSLHVASGLTSIEGDLRDQSELFGVLDRIRDLGLELVRVEPLSPIASAPRPSTSRANREGRSAPRAP